ncbi:Abi family protein [Abyssisolibacter fermentans]|uniref:Abi family protein n=1 Tax=Abyssisolibacter fermentans TaxID=1766203 RepID=UPI000831CC05|nr:Abi family protein [Abyssisolibacter fermentans]
MFKSKKHHDSMLQVLQIKRSNELFINHYKLKYNEMFPIWVVVEVSSFGLLSKIYSNLKDEDQNKIASEYYNTKGEYIRTWLHAISTFRNICAHYGRIYNRNLEITPKLFRKDKKRGINNDSIFAIVYIIGRLLTGEKDWDYFITRFIALVEQYDIVDLSLMGFPKDWKQILKDLR